MINNIQLILPFLKFESKDDFYYLQILQRKKENPQLGSNSRVIKNYYITSEQYLLDKYDEIKKLCEVFNARAMIRLNKRSFEKVGFKCMTNLANTMMNKEYSFVKASYDRACGLSHNDSEKKWILDVDFALKSQHVESMKKQLYQYEPVGEKILSIIPSKSGYHIIIKPCDLRNFNSTIDKHKDNPTNLYIP
jgi:hypothetical protein